MGGASAPKPVWNFHNAAPVLASTATKLPSGSPRRTRPPAVTIEPPPPPMRYASDAAKRSCCWCLDRAEGAGLRRADRRRKGAGDVALPAFVGIAIAHEGACANVGRNIEISGVGTIGHWRPDGATPGPGLNQHRLLPEGLEEAAGLFVIAKRRGALRHNGVADRVGLGLRRLLARLLRHRPFLDAEQRLAVGPIEQIDPTCLAGLGDALPRLAVDHRVEQYDRADCIIIPDVVVHFLEMPGVFPALGLQRNDRGAEQIIAVAHRPVEIGTAIAGGKVNEPELGIECRGIPDRRATTHGMISVRWPGLRAGFAESGQRVPTPKNRPGLGIERRQPATHAELAAGYPAVNNAVVIKRRARDAVAIVPVLERHLPHLLACLDVERDDIGIELAQKQHSLAHRQTTIVPAAAYG